MTWQPIETAPKDGTRILAYTLCGEFEIVEYYEISKASFVEAENGLYRRVESVEGYWSGNGFKYWQPLPPPPESE